MGQFANSNFPGENSLGGVFLREIHRRQFLRRAKIFLITQDVY